MMYEEVDQYNSEIEIPAYAGMSIIIKLVFFLENVTSDFSTEWLSRIVKFEILVRLSKDLLQFCFQCSPSQILCDDFPFLIQ